MFMLWESELICEWNIINEEMVGLIIFFFIFNKLWINIKYILNKWIII